MARYKDPLAALFGGAAEAVPGAIKTYNERKNFLAQSQLEEELARKKMAAEMAQNAMLYMGADANKVPALQSFWSTAPDEAADIEDEASRIRNESAQGRLWSSRIPELGQMEVKSAPMFGPPNQRIRTTAEGGVAPKRGGMSPLETLLPERVKTYETGREEAKTLHEKQRGSTAAPDFSARLERQKNVLLSGRIDKTFGLSPKDADPLAALMEADLKRPLRPVELMAIRRATNRGL